MDTFDAIGGRRSVKHYDPEHRLSEDEITRLMGAAILSPTSFNMQNWRFVLVTDPALRQQIRAAAYNQAQVSEASLLIIMTADLLAWKKDPQRYWRDAPKDVSDAMVKMMVPFHEGNEQLQRDEAIRSIGIAAQTIMLTAKARDDASSASPKLLVSSMTVSAASSSTPTSEIGDVTTGSSLAVVTVTVNVS